MRLSLSLMAYLRTLPDSPPGIRGSITADDIIQYFQAGFGIDPHSGDKVLQLTIEFIPNALGDGVRWDNRINWSNEDYPPPQMATTSIWPETGSITGEPPQSRTSISVRAACCTAHPWLSAN